MYLKPTKSKARKLKKIISTLLQLSCVIVFFLLVYYCKYVRVQVFENVVRFAIETNMPKMFVNKGGRKMSDEYLERINVC